MDTAYPAALVQSDRDNGQDNQTPPLVDYDLFSTDRVLQEALRYESRQSGLNDRQIDSECARLTVLGTELGRSENFELGRLANQYPPVLRTHNPHGQRIDVVEFHPAWHQLMQAIVSHGLHSGPWHDGEDGAMMHHGLTSGMTHTLRAAAYLMQGQIEQGTLCPATMTYGAIAVLRKDAALAAQWMSKLLSRQYDPRDLPWGEKNGGLIGMGMTEKQGGSDVRANSTRAERQSDGSYRITGHKWFFSAPQSDAHLVLAQAECGLTCFFLPRYQPDGNRNAIHIQRLKDKVGNRSNASGEVEFDAAWAQRLGEEGRGVSTIIEMATYTRLDCVLGTAAMMRQAVVQAIHHALHRKVFGRLLIEQPLMQNVLADLALESCAATAIGLRLARAFDAVDRDDETESTIRRVLTSAAKFWVCKRGPELAAEAMEVLGGNGYVEEGPLARIYREMPVNSIWEGSGNIMCLDVLRAFGKSPRTSEVLLAELAAWRGLNKDYDSAFERFAAQCQATDMQESAARRLVQSLVTLMQAGLLLQSTPEVVAAGFCASRLPGLQWGAVYGLLPTGIDAVGILEHAWSE